MARKSEQLQIRVTPGEKAALNRRARRAGLSLSAYVLSRSLPPEGARFAEILDALRADADPRSALAELNDFLAALAPPEFDGAVADAPLEELEPWLRNYVAAMVEQAAGQKGMAAPEWVRTVAPPEEPRFATDLPGLRLHLLRASPVPFKRRNLYVDSGVGARV